MYYRVTILMCMIIPLCLEGRRRESPFPKEKLVTGEVVSTSFKKELPVKIADTYRALKIYPNLEVVNKTNNVVSITVNGGKTHSLAPNDRLIQSIDSPFLITVVQGSRVKAYNVTKKYFFGEILDPDLRLEPQKLIWHYTLTNLRFGYYATESEIPIVDLKEVAQKKDIDGVPSYYEILGLQSNASYAQIEQKGCEILKKTSMSSKPALLEALHYAGIVALAREDINILSAYLNFLTIDRNLLSQLTKDTLYEKYKASLKTINKDLSLDQSVERFNNINEAYKIISLYLYTVNADRYPRKITPPTLPLRLNNK